MSQNPEKKQKSPSLTGLLIGLVLMGGGIYFLLSSISISSISFYHFGKVSSGPILIFLFVVLLVWAIAKDGKLQWVLLFLDVLCMIGSAILGTVLYLKRMDLFTLLLMVALFAVGLGLVIRNLRPAEKK